MIISLHDRKWSIFIEPKEYVYCSVRMYLSVIVVKIIFQWFNQICICSRNLNVE